MRSAGQAPVDRKVSDGVEDPVIVGCDDDDICEPRTHHPLGHNVDQWFAGKETKRLMGESGRAQSSRNDAEDRHGKR
jgi:hypothetical protein